MQPPTRDATGDALASIDGERALVAPEGSATRRRPARTAFLLALFCFVVFNANLRQVGAGDTLPARYLPLALWRYHTLTLDPIARLVAHGHPLQKLPVAPGGATRLEPYAYWMAAARHGHLVSVYPVVAPLLVTPLYLPAALYLRHRGWEQPHVDWIAELMEKLSASLLAALAVALVYLLLRRDAGRWSIGLALAFALGTDTWMISSQALWQHGAGELLIALALLLVTADDTPARAAALGAVCVVAAANRPPDALLAGAIALYALAAHRRTAAWVLAGAALPLVAILLYNVGVIGSLSGGYGLFTAPRFFAHSLAAGLLGLLVSPTRGLLVFSPFLLFVPVGLRQRLRGASTRGLALALTAGVIAQLLLYAPADWRAGASWGPRWLTDVLPILLWMLAPAPLFLRSLGRSVLVVAIGASIAVQTIGAFWYTKVSDVAVLAGSPRSMRGAWDIHAIPFLVELRHPPAPAELTQATRGAIDRIGSTLHPAALAAPPELAPGGIVEGWALAGTRSPAQLFLLVDGVVVGTSEHFLARPDVAAVMDTAAPAGWRVAADLRGVRPGEHVLQAAARVEPRSDFRLVAEQRVVVAAAPAGDDARAAAPGGAGLRPGLVASAARAASLLREHQSTAGYWLTSYTAAPTFVNARPEMNTFLTAMVIDLVSPGMAAHGLADAVERARRHLGAQIEGDGLVRYHGRPDGATIGTLGCVISPDADDTALAWRIAGPGAADPRRATMLRTLARYRDARGLYRTWLAPRDRYRCLDPGHDPDPADATIQMHVLLMLRELDAGAARDLCRALQGAIGDDDVWVYYARAPLIPFLRAAELRQRGCAVAVPEQRLDRVAPAQEPWSAAARLLAGMTTTSGAAQRPAAEVLLARLAADDFALIRQAPPLLYHNDLTATVPRYYWSVDFAYALWLRLYDAAQSGAEPPLAPASGAPR